MICLCGYTASGKDRICSELQKIGYSKVISHTTRPKRLNEVDGENYYFVTEEEFSLMKFAETSRFTVENGEIWYYGTTYEELSKENAVMIVNPTSYKNIDIPDKVLFQLFVPDETTKKRLSYRGTNKLENERRLKADKKDIKSISDNIDYVIQNDKSPEEVAAAISELYQSHFKKKLYIDFDGVIVNTIKAIVDLYNMDYKYYEINTVSQDEIKTWDFEELQLASGQEINKYFTQPRFFNILEFMPWAKKTLENLHEEYDETIVSMGHSANLVGKSFWIKDNLPYVKHIGIDFAVYKNKKHIDMSDGIFIDDCYENLVNSNAKVKICFGKEYEWNKEWDGIRCLNWVEVEKYLKGGDLDEEKTHH